MQVKIYTYSSIHGPSKRDGYWGYVLEYIKSNGEPETRTNIGKVEGATENVLTLIAITNALRRLNRKCEVKIVTSCDYVVNSIQNFWPVQWQKNNWINSKGKAVRNVEYWQQYLVEASKHSVMISQDDNSYHKWLESEVKKIEKIDSE